MNSTSFKFSRLVLVALLLGFFAAAVSPQPAFAATLVLSADTFPSTETLNWARAGSTITVTVNDVTGLTVTIDIDSDEADDFINGFPLTEVGTTGVCTADFTLSSASSSATILRVDPKNDNVTVTYPQGNLRRDFDIENEEPDVEVVTPDHEDVFDDQKVEFVVEVTDDDSGLTDPADLNAGIVNIVFLLSDVQCGEQDGDIPGGDGLLSVLDGTHITMSDLRTDIEALDCDGVGGSDISVVIPDPNFDFDAIDDGQELVFDLFLASGQTSYVGVAAVDDAGNFEIFNVDRTENAETLIEVTVDEDDPTISRVRTGVNWDAFNDRYLANQRDWLQVVFSDITDLDGGTVEKDDFVVEGHTIRQVQFFDLDPDSVTDFEDVDGTPFDCTDQSGASQTCDANGDGDLDAGLEILHPLNGGADINAFAYIARSVFIQLEDEMESDETPNIFIVPDGVDDEAGNTNDNDQALAEDWIGPGLRLASLSSDFASPGDETELVFSTDEELADPPVVTVTFVNAPPGSVVDGIIADPAIGESRQTISTPAPLMTWEATIQAPDITGFYNIFIEGVDGEGNIGELGISPDDIKFEFFEPDGDVNKREAIFFEGDISLPRPLLSLEEGEEVAGPLELTIDFGSTEGLSEAFEYEADSHQSVELTLFEIDGVDRLADISVGDGGGGAGGGGGGARSLAAVISPQVVSSGSLTLTADTFASGERLEWARAGSTITVTVVDTTGLTVTADIDSIAIGGAAGEISGFSLPEIGGTGVYTANFTLSATSSSPTILQVDEVNDRVTVLYEAASPRFFDIENEEPNIVVITPDHEDKVDDSAVGFVVEVTDDRSGLTDPDDMDEVRIVFLLSDVQCGEQDGDITGGEGLLAVLDGTQITMTDLITDIEALDCDGVGGPDIFVVIPDPDFDFDSIDDGQQLTFDLFLASGQSSYVGVAAMDDAGNFEIFNVDPLDEDVVLLEVTVDEIQPRIDVVRTGVKWDAVNDRYLANQRDWLQVLFADETNLDPLSIDADDFIIEGHTVSSVWWFDVSPEEMLGGPDSVAPHAGGPQDVDGLRKFMCRLTSGGGPVPCDTPGARIFRPSSSGWGGTDPDDDNKFAMIRNSVFIQLVDDLAAGETPDLNLVPNGIDDEAGNTNDNDDEEAEDWINPIIDVTVVPGMPLTLTVSSDEELFSAVVILSTVQCAENDEFFNINSEGLTALVDRDSPSFAAASSLGALVDAIESLDCDGEGEGDIQIITPGEGEFTSIPGGHRIELGIVLGAGDYFVGVAADDIAGNLTISNEFDGDLSKTLEPLTVDSSIALGIVGDGDVFTAVDFVAAETEVAVQVSDEDLIGQATVDVDVSSESGGGGFTLTLAKVEDSVNIFRGSFVVSDTTDSNNADLPAAEPRPRLQAVHGNLLMGTYDGVSPSLTDELELDAEGPDITSLLPPDGTLSNDFTPRFTVDVTETGSGVDVGSITFLESPVQLADADLEALVIAESFDELPPTGTQAIADGFSAFTILDLPTGTKFVGVVASDLLGNVSIFDVDDDDADRTLSEITAETTLRLLVSRFVGGGGEGFGFGALAVGDVNFANTGTEITVRIDDADLDLNAGAIETVDVTVSSDSDPSGFSLTLSEVATSSSIFLGSFVVAPSTDPSNADNADAFPRPTLTAPHLDEITAKYNDLSAGILRRDSLFVDDEAPVIENFLPEDGSALDDELVSISADITDDEAGLIDFDDLQNASVIVLISDFQCTDDDMDALFELEGDGPITQADLVLAIEGLDCSGFGPFGITAFPVDESDFQGIEGGVRLEMELFFSPGVWFIGLVAVDEAGNLAVLDADPSEDTRSLAEIIIDLDEPNLAHVRTGVKWDAAENQYQANQREWLHVVFSDITNLDGDSIGKDDFVVEGHTVRSVQWFDVDPEDVTDFEDFDGTSFDCTNSNGSTRVCDGDFDGVLDDGLEILHPLEGGANINIFAFIGRSVFIQLEDELESDETPDVNLVPNGVDDEAGNTNDNDEETDTDDKIAPGFMVESISPLLAGPDVQVELIVTSDEDLDDDPTVTVTLVLRGQEDSVGHEVEDTTAGGEIDADVEEIGLNRWLATIDGPDDTGYYNIFISGTDEENNAGTEGIDPDDLAEDDEFWKANGEVNIDDAIFFEGDIDLPAPLFTPGDFDEIPFEDVISVSVDFGVPADGADRTESTEYAGDSFGEVELLHFELDGIDLTDLMQTDDDKLFDVEIINFAIGDHDIVVLASDAAGNVRQFESSFEVVPADLPPPQNKFLATVFGLSTGDHTLRLNAVDEAGNTLGEDLILNFTVSGEDQDPVDDGGVGDDGGGSGGGGGGGGARATIAFAPEFMSFEAVEGGDDPEPQTLRVSTSRNRSVLRFAISTDVAWLRAAPIEGISDATNDRERITVSVNISGLDVGSHTGEITISARRATNDPQTVPVTLVILSAPEPGVISIIRVAIDSSEPTVIVTPDNQVQVTIPLGALTDDEDGGIEIEVKNVEVSSVPDAPDDTVIVRAIELNTLVDGEISPVDYTEPVELVFVLTEADLALADGDTSRLAVLWLSEETGEWEFLPVSYESDPPPAGRLIALLDHFSVYAMGVLEEAPREERQVKETATPTPAPTPVLTATSVPTPVPTQAAGAVETSTPVPATPTAITVAQVVSTPVPTATPQPTATAAPPALTLPAAPAPPSQPPTEPGVPPVVEGAGGIGTATIVILIVVGIAVLAGVAVVGQGLWSRRRQA